MRLFRFPVIALIFSGMCFQASAYEMKCSGAKQDFINNTITTAFPPITVDVIVGSTKDGDKTEVGTIEGYKFKVYSPMTIASAILVLSAESASQKVETIRDLSARPNMLSLSISTSENVSIRVSCEEQPQMSLQPKQN